MGGAEIFLVSGVARQIDIATLVIAREGLYFQFACQVEDGRLSGACPLPSGLRDHTAAELMVDGSSPYSIPSLQYGEGGAASAMQISGCGEAGKPGADDNHVQYI
ncbi:hypothetical protein KAM380_022790 [Aeromonas caviae]|nr:hypothetical protein KAM380_022790 [Aeromonas caviae]